LFVSVKSFIGCGRHGLQAMEKSALIREIRGLGTVFCSRIPKYPERFLAHLAPAGMEAGGKS